MKLIVGLGNPGRIYAENRHNIGFMCVNHFGKTQHIKFSKSAGQARIGSGEVAGEIVVLARPQTYMNSSGDSLSRLAKRFKLDVADIIVVHDDLDLPLGKIRIRQGGSSGGHKGIDSIIARLGSPDFTHLKVGIGRPLLNSVSSEDKEAAIVDYVLSDFTLEEKKVIDQFLPRVSEALLCLLTEDLTTAMNRYN